MTITAYEWGSTTTDGVWLDDLAKTDIWALKNIEVNLRSHDKTITAMNNIGVIITDIDFRLEDRVKELEFQVHNISNEVFSISERVRDLEKLPTKPEEDVDTQTGEEFYLLYGMLPEDFKKKLKIYIKK